ncbi:hypothetical protein WN51_10519, partial [Melipona quadrifasciata]
LSCPNRRIVSYAPRNTKPPIREPNMPEKREKKDDKKDKKKKKPVIRMESGSSADYQNEGNAKVADLHDNLDVNFRWDVRFPEESDTNRQSALEENWGKDTRQAENSVVGDSNYPNAVQAMKNLQLMMSSAKDTEKKKGDTTELSGEKANKPLETTPTDALKNTDETANLDPLKKILKTSPTLMKETNVDEDYNVPSNGSFDAEINAWKDLVLKSKMPLDSPKEDVVSSERHSTLSIRPEPPEPKLDVQAVPSSSDEAAAEEEDPEHAREFKGNVAGMDVKRASNPTDFQKVDSKKLHTGPSCFSGRKSRSPGFSWILNSLDNHVNSRSSDFSTDAEGGWGNIQQTVSEGITREQLKNLEKSEGAEENVANVGSSNENAVVSERQRETRNFESREQSDRELADSLDTVTEKEMEVSLNRPQSTNEDSVSASSQSDSRKYETDDYLKAQTDNYQSNFDYANPYEDDFYPGYESTSLESTAEQSFERNEKSSVANEPQISNDKEVKFVKEMEQQENREHTTDDNYIKVPGDPYPYSREHFNKWRWHENYGIGPPKTEEVPNSPIDNSNTSVEVDTEQPIQKMSYYLFRTEPTKLNDPPSENPSSSSGTIILSNSANPPNDGGESSLIENGEMDIDLGETEDSKKIDKKKEKIEHVETIHPEIHTHSSGHISNKDGKKSKLVRKEDIERIYEQKNYAYLRPEEMKNLRLVSKPTPEDTDPDTSDQKSGENKP